MVFFDASKIPKGKEGRHVIAASAVIIIFAGVFVADLLDGAIKWKGATEPVPFADAPFSTLLFFLFVMAFGVQLLRYFGSAVIAFQRSRKSDPKE